MSAATPAATALSVRNVVKMFRIHHERANSLKQFLATGGRNRYEEFYALRDVSFEVPDGTAVGVIGHNGSGKSTLLKCMAGILQPTSGSIEVRRRMSALLELGAGFHPELSGRDNVYLNAAILGMTRREISKRFDAIVDFSGLDQFIDTPVKTYSSGMYVRLAFAVAINVDPELLLIDEILAVGDVSFQQRCMAKFAEFREEGRTLVLVTHDLGSVRNFCDQVVWIDHGVVAGEGPPGELIDRYVERMLATGHEEETEGGARRGSGELRIERAELYVDGHRTTQPRTGDVLTVRMPFTATGEVANPVVTVRVATLNGTIVSAPNTRDGRTVPAYVRGDGIIELTVPDLALLPGPHVIHTEVTSFDHGYVYDHLQNAARFDVVAADGGENEGLVTLHPSWSIYGDDVAPHSERFPG